MIPLGLNQLASSTKKEKSEVNYLSQLSTNSNTCCICRHSLQVAIEVPYVLFQVTLFMIIAYPAIGFEWTTAKFLWFFYTMFCSLLYMIYLGMMLVAMTPTVQLATILQSVFYQLLNLFSGFVIPRPVCDEYILPSPDTI
jgi:ABC-2 type transporter